MTGEHELGHALSLLRRGAADLLFDAFTREHVAYVLEKAARVVQRGAPPAPRAAPAAPRAPAPAAGAAAAQAASGGSGALILVVMFVVLAAGAAGAYFGGFFQ